MTVDWEGETIPSSENLAALRRLIAMWGDGVIHFVCTGNAYKESPLEYESALRSVLRPNDAVAVHIHAHEEHVRTVCTKSETKLDSFETAFGTWHSILLDSLPLSCLRDLFEYERGVLNDLVVDTPVLNDAWRAGAWVSSKGMRSWLRDTVSLKVDYSSVSPSDVIASPPLHQKLVSVWGGSPSLPYVDKGVVIVPNNGCLVDWLNDEKVLEKRVMSHPFFVFGCHADTSALYETSMTRIVSVLPRSGLSATQLHCLAVDMAKGTRKDSFLIMAILVVVFVLFKCFSK